MSTKIFGGFRITHPGAKDFLALQALLDDLSATLTERARTLTHLHVLRSALERFDQDSLRKAGLLKEADMDAVTADAHQDEQDGYITGAILRLLERATRIEQERRRDAAVDMGCEVVLLPHESGLYGIVYAENRHIEDAFFAMDGIEHFAYWNNTERPEEISEDDWAARGRLWSALLPGSGVPAERGLARTLSPVCVIPSVEEVVSFWLSHADALPAFDSRVQAHVLNALADELIARLPPSNSLAPVSREIRRARESDEPEIVALRAKLGCRIRAALTADVTPEHLLAPSRRAKPAP